MTTIEWANPPGFKGESWNFITGCTMGCHYCYAAKIAHRFWGERAFTDVQFHPERIDQPLRWKKPRCVFVNSMGDWADPLVADGWLDQAFEVMLNTPEHRYLLLTKQPERAYDYLSQVFCDRRKVPNHIWVGVSVENQVAANGRLAASEKLSEICELTWVSYEPAIDRVNWLGWDFLSWMVIGGMSGMSGMSGQYSSPFDLNWGREAIEWCRSNGVKPFVKQIGSNPFGAIQGDHWILGKRQQAPYQEKWSRIEDAKGADMSEWPTDLQVREWPL